MAIYLINILLLVFWKFVFLKDDQLKINIYRNGKKYFCIMASLQWFILSAFRHNDIGNDTWYYGQLFNDVASKSWGEVFHECELILKGTVEGRDVGYIILEKSVSSIYNDYRFFLIIVAALLAVTLGKFIYENSIDVFFSYLLFSCLFYNFFAITGQRQTIVTCIVVFAGYPLIRDKKMFKFLLLAIIMSFIHKSCLIYILLYIVSKIKVNRISLMVTGIIAVLFFIFKNSVFTFWASISGYDKLYSIVEGAGAKTFTLLLVAIFLAIFMFYDIILQVDKYSYIWIHAICLSVIFVPLTFVEPNTMRIVQYFSVFLMLLIPALIKCIKVDQQYIVKLVIELVLVVLFISTKPVYYFMW